MKVFHTGSLDNCMCQYAYEKGFSHIQIDNMRFKIVVSEQYGYDFVDMVIVEEARAN